VLDRFVNPPLDQPLQLALLAEVPYDAAVRESIQQRLLLLETFPGSPAAVGIVAAAGKLLPP
jgi:flagellar biosynthesis protein FlhG